MFRECNVDTTRIALGGFSNGASYALSLGVYNGDLFSALLAFSPGFYAPGKTRTASHLRSHDTNDPLLMNPTTPLVVPRLRSEGYTVTYRDR